jgi:bifunctional UDP-N-acetylglucosamine pyrophosphorylase/glucosamine-1-phosphate N-acetyltransferase
MRAGVTLADPNRFDVRGTVVASADVHIDVNVVLEGKVTLGEGVVISANCVLKDVVLGSGCVVAPFSHIEGAEIGQACQIGPYARIRPGTCLSDNVKVGNFVETKKAQVGQGSKINHLSYVGDAELGEQVNVGAGTITCNYDGVNKYKTCIADNVFVGSNTALVAPVTVAEGATIAAGSTIVSDVPADKLTVARARQTTHPTWQRPTKEK